jgi:RNA polymerase sigma-70 factor (ECF subfamily)
MGTTTAAVNSAMQRARKLVDERLPEPSQQETLAALDDAKLQDIVGRYTTALEEGDMDALLAMLTEDATWSMPPLAAWFRGRDAIAGFLETGPFTVDWRHRMTRANGQVAIGCYGWDEARGVYIFAVLDVMRLRGDRVAEVVAFIDADLAVRFGLPTELPA